MQHGSHHEAAFDCCTTTAGALYRVIARATERMLAQLLSEQVWRKLGTEQDAYMIVNPTGTPFAGGALNAGPRKLVRFGGTVLIYGYYNGQPIVPAAAVAPIRRGGRRSDFDQAGYRQLPGWSDRGMRWVTYDAHGAVGTRGVPGHTLYIDPAAEFVVARFASQPMAANAANDGPLPTWQAPALHRMAKDR